MLSSLMLSSPIYLYLLCKKVKHWNETCASPQLPAGSSCQQTKNNHSSVSHKLQLKKLAAFFFFPCSLSFLPKITQNKTFHPKKQTINLTFQKGLAFHRHLLCWYKNRFDFLLLLLRLAFQCEFMALKATNGSLLVLQQVTSLLAGVQVVVCLDETVLQAWPDVGVDALKPCC